AAALLLIAAAPAGARDPACARDPDVIGPCFSVHGKLFWANGTPSARMLRLGTRRILGVSERHRGYMPDALRARGAWDDVVYGDFLVGPFSAERRGHMQFVCVEGGSKLVLEKKGGGRVVLSRLPDVSGP